MRGVRSVTLVLAASALFALMLGTSAFTESGGERAVAVDVVDDDEAYLGVEQTIATTNDTRNLTVTVRNRFGTELTTVHVALPDASADAGPLVPGEAADVTFTNASCTDSLSIDADGAEVAVSLSRSVAC